MKIYFEDGQLISETNKMLAMMYGNVWEANAVLGVSACIRIATAAQMEKDSEIVIYTNCTELLNNRYAWNDELKVPEVYIRQEATGEFVRVDKCTSRELREGHDLRRMYMAGEFDSVRCSMSDMSPIVDEEAAKQTASDFLESMADEEIQTSESNKQEYASTLRDSPNIGFVFVCRKAPALSMEAFSQKLENNCEARLKQEGDAYIMTFIVYTDCNQYMVHQVRDLLREAVSSVYGSALYIIQRGYSRTLKLDNLGRLSDVVELDSPRAETIIPSLDWPGMKYLDVTGVKNFVAAAVMDVWARVWLD